MVDATGRKITYLRLSITDRCNLRCNYCLPHPIENIAHGDILRYEEILRVCGVMVNLGVTNIRVTGGEPLVRRGCVEFLHELKKIANTSLTTNGVLLEPYVKNLADINVNISLDSLNPERMRY